MPYVTTSDGAQLYYETVGQGPPVVIFPGWTMTRYAVSRLVDTLREDYRVTVVEPRAHGRSTDTVHGHRIARYARDMYEVLEVLDGGPATLVAWSMAASTLLAYWEHFQSAYASGFVFVDFSPKLLNDDEWSLGFGTGDAAEQLISACKDDFPAAVASFVPSMFSVPLDDEDLATFVTESLQMPGGLAARVLTEHVAQDWTDMVSTITVPTLVCHGALSYFPIDAGRFVADRVEGAEFELIEASGHAIPWEQPDALASAIGRFVRNSAGRGGSEPGATVEPG